MKQLYSFLVAGALGFASFCGIGLADNPAPVRAERPKGLDQVIDATYKLRNTIGVQMQLISNTDDHVIATNNGQKMNYASCFGIAHTNSGTYFLTAAHAMKENDTELILHAYGLVREERQEVSQRIELIDSEGTQERVLGTLEQVVKDTELDISLLHGAGQFNTYRFFVDPADVRLADRAYGIGFPHGNRGSFGKSIFEGIITCIENDFNQTRWVHTSATLNPGMSGGPTVVILDSRAFILGVNSIQYRPEDIRDTYGVAKNIKEFFDRNPRYRAIWREVF
ncbi:trypsin-like peptidase domain-containing protein [Candidatus Woesearchaeota archaeon]|nr:trypsin-like peptidase domain-containing protein [Candidatus Woesearchaeota archaeon]